MACIHTKNKASINKLRNAMYDFDEKEICEVLSKLLTPDTIIHMPWPLGDMNGPDQLYKKCYEPLVASIPDLERRDWIVVGGLTESGHEWVGCGGHYTGTFLAPWLDIPPTGHIVHMRFHEFYKFQNGKVAEIQTIWDIPEVMMQANSWPMAPSLGREYHIPGPATLDGILEGPWNKEKS
ncbi:MAG: ester cyclase, partial [Paracoccaceae bacterium]